MKERMQTGSNQGKQGASRRGRGIEGCHCHKGTPYHGGTTSPTEVGPRSPLPIQSPQPPCPTYWGQHPLSPIGGSTLVAHCCMMAPLQEESARALPEAPPPAARRGGCGLILGGPPGWGVELSGGPPAAGCEGCGSLPGGPPTLGWGGCMPPLGGRGPLGGASAGRRVPACSNIRLEGDPVEDDSVGARAGGGAGTEAGVEGGAGMETSVQVMPPREKRETVRETVREAPPF